jgi:hypothetical protein
MSPSCEIFDAVYSKFKNSPFPSHVVRRLVPTATNSTNDGHKGLLVPTSINRRDRNIVSIQKERRGSVDLQLLGKYKNEANVNLRGLYIIQLLSR